MVRTFLPVVRNLNTAMSRSRSKFSIHRRDNLTLGMTLGRYILLKITIALFQISPAFKLMSNLRLKIS